MTRFDDTTARHASPFREGEAVTIISGEKGPQSLTTVRRFLHGGRCMELADGTQWRSDGKRQWNYGGSFYRGPVVEPRRPEDEAHVNRRRAIGAIRKFANDLNADSPLSADALLRIQTVIQEETAAVAGLAAESRDGDASDADGA